MVCICSAFIFDKTTWWFNTLIHSIKLYSFHHSKYMWTASLSVVSNTEKCIVYLVDAHFQSEVQMRMSTCLRVEKCDFCVSKSKESVQAMNGGIIFSSFGISYRGWESKLMYTFGTCWLFQFLLHSFVMFQLYSI